MFYVRRVFFEAGVKGASSFADVEMSAFGTISNGSNAEFVVESRFGLAVWR